MQNASTELKQLLAGARNYPGLLRVKFGVVDITVAPDVTLTTNDAHEMSNLPDIVDNRLVNDYITLERNSFILGRGGSILPDVGHYPIGYMTNALSDNYRVVPNVYPDPMPELPPEEEIGKPRPSPFATKLVVTATMLHSIIGLSLRFDTFRNNWCRVHIETFRGTTLVDTEKFDVNAAEYVIEHPFDNWNRMEISFITTSVPRRRVRLTGLAFGIYRTDDEFESATVKSEFSPISDKLPTDMFEWTLFNLEQEFRPGQETGVQKYIMEQQPVEYEWGYPLSDGTVEWVLGGKLFTTGEVTFPKDRVTLKASGTLSYLTDVYNKGVYNPSGVSLYDLAEAVLLDTDLPTKRDGTRRWRLWEGLRNIYTTAPLPKVQGRVCLQLIANAGGCVFVPDREGDIVIAPLDTTQHDMVINYDSQTSQNAEPHENPPLYSVVVGVGSYVVGASTELHKSTRRIVGTEVVFVEYSEATGLSATITGGSIVSAKYYAAYAEITITANGDVTLTVRGTPITRSDWKYEKIYGLTGEILPFDNVLCTNEAVAEIIAKSVGDFYVKRTIYNASYNGHILLDALDRIWLENDFQDKQSGLVISNNIVYNGAWRGAIKWSN